MASVTYFHGSPYTGYSGMGIHDEPCAMRRTTCWNPFKCPAMAQVISKLMVTTRRYQYRCTPRHRLRSGARAIFISTPLRSLDPFPTRALYTFTSVRPSGMLRACRSNIVKTLRTPLRAKMFEWLPLTINRIAKHRWLRDYFVLQALRLF